VIRESQAAWFSSFTLSTDVGADRMKLLDSALDVFYLKFITKSISEKFWKSDNSWWSYGQEFGVLFFLTRSVVVFHEMSGCINRQHKDKVEHDIRNVGNFLTVIFVQYTISHTYNISVAECLAHLTAVWEDPGSNHATDSCVYRDSCCGIQSWARAVHLRFHVYFYYYYYLFLIYTHPTRRKIRYLGT